MTKIGPTVLSAPASYMRLLAPAHRQPCSVRLPVGTMASCRVQTNSEWGETRFIAVMYGNDSPMVGPVRSGRYFDEHIARMYHAFLAFKGADPRELSYLENSTLNDFLVVVYSNNSTCPPVVIGPERRDSYNNAFFNTTKWAACAARKGIDNSKQALRGGFFVPVLVWAVGGVYEFGWPSFAKASERF